MSMPKDAPSGSSAEPLTALSKDGLRTASLVRGVRDEMARSGLLSSSSSLLPR